MMWSCRPRFPDTLETPARSASFLLLFEQRQGAIGSIAIAAGAVLGLTLPLVARSPLHFVYGIVAVLMMLTQAA